MLTEHHVLLLHLYRHVFGIDFPWLILLRQSTKSFFQLAVLTREGADAVLRDRATSVSGKPRLYMGMMDLRQLGAFRDGVLATIIAIMAFELNIPHGA